MTGVDGQPHMAFPEIWALKDGPNPQVLERYLSWLTEDGERFASATNSMQWLPVGFNALLVARHWDNQKATTAESLQLNFYSADQQGNEGPHGHSRPAVTSWYAHPDARQVFTRHLPLPEGARRINDLPIQERLLAANCIIDHRDGRRPGYHPVILGSRLILEQSVTRIAPLGSQWFGSLEVHHIGFDGPGVAISVHHKAAEEPEALSDLEGLIYYKGMTSDQAEEIAEVRSGLLIETSPDGPRLGPVTMLYPPTDFDIQEMEPIPTSTDPTVAEDLILGGLKTVSYLAKAA